MKLDAFVTSVTVEEASATARRLEEAGFHGIWLTETQVDPFLPLAVAATATTRIRLGTGIAVAFARSPMVMAMDAWALQRASGGRVDLGLGTQVRAHVERRFAMPYDRPIARIREYVGALRHIWGAFQGEHRLAFRGEFYRHDLLSPFFDPGPIARPRIAVHLAAVNARMFRLAGEIADGAVAHPFSTPAYLRETALPALERGLARGGRARADFAVTCPVFTLVESSPAFSSESRSVREQLAFYASTPAYRPVLAHHGWEHVGEQLSSLARAGRFDALADVVTDQMLEAFVTSAPSYGALGERLRARYGGILDRVALYGDATRIAPADMERLTRSLA